MDDTSDSPYFAGRSGWLDPALCEAVVRAAWNRKSHLAIPDATCRDLVQDVTIAFYEAWTKQPAGAIPDPRAYASGIASNKVALLFRRRAKRQVTLCDDGELEQAHRTEETPEAIAIQADSERNALDGVRDRLSPRDRRVLDHFLTGGYALRPEDAAASLEMTTRAYNQSLYRIRLEARLGMRRKFSDRIATFIGSPCRNGAIALMAHAEDLGDEDELLANAAISIQFFNLALGESGRLMQPLTTAFASKPVSLPRFFDAVAERFFTNPAFREQCATIDELFALSEAHGKTASKIASSYTPSIWFMGPPLASDAVRRHRKFSALDPIFHGSLEIVDGISTLNELFRDPSQAPHFETPAKVFRFFGQQLVDGVATLGTSRHPYTRTVDLLKKHLLIDPNFVRTSCHVLLEIGRLLESENSL